jgi:hypothetical protein
MAGPRRLLPLVVIALLSGTARAQSSPPVARFADVGGSAGVADFSNAEPPRAPVAVATFAWIDFRAAYAETRARHLLDGDPYQDMLIAAEQRRRDDPSIAYAGNLMFTNPYTAQLQFANPYTEQMWLANPYTEELRFSDPYR